MSIPIADENDHLVGVVTVDDVLDKLLPEDWRRAPDDDIAAAAADDEIKEGTR